MAIDINKQVEYWRGGAEEDMAVAELLIEQRRTRYALFFGHLMLEKALKALVTRATGDIPPRTHDLLRLATLGEVVLTAQQRVVLLDMQQYNLEGRYPSDWPAVVEPELAKSDLARAKELAAWLLKQ